MKRRDIVQATNPGNPLHCGSGVYPDAVVLFPTPQVLVSRAGDMRWSCYKGDLKVVGQVSWFRYLYLWFKRRSG